jgi:hypothetical protein
MHYLTIGEPDDSFSAGSAEHRVLDFGSRCEEESAPRFVYGA